MLAVDTVHAPALLGIDRVSSLSVRAKERIEAAIWSGQLRPGARLVETQLASQFQISRGPLREALKALAAEGLVDIRPARGTFVADPSPNEMQDMIVLRAILGGMAARYVAAGNDATLLATLAAPLQVMRDAVARDDERAFFDQHWEFYEAMYRATTNGGLLKVWSSMHGLIDIYVRRLGRPHIAMAHILRCYETYLDLFRAGDPDEAEAVVRSQSILVGFRVLQRPIPPALRGYVTREILADGSIVVRT